MYKEGQKNLDFACFVMFILCIFLREYMRVVCIKLDCKMNALSG